MSDKKPTGSLAAFKSQRFLVLELLDSVFLSIVHKLQPNLIAISNEPLKKRNDHINFDFACIVRSNSILCLLHDQ